MAKRKANTRSTKCTSSSNAAGSQAPRNPSTNHNAAAAHLSSVQDSDDSPQTEKTSAQVPQQQEDSQQPLGFQTFQRKAVAPVPVKMFSFSNLHTPEAKTGTACICCETICLLSNVGPDMNAKIGLYPYTTDTFFPSICRQCDTRRGHTWIRHEHVAPEPSSHQQWPPLISLNLLRSWPLYQVLKPRYQLTLDENQKAKVVLRPRDWWKLDLAHINKSFLKTSANNPQAVEDASDISGFDFFGVFNQV